jgi:hypothetical protein
MELNEKEMLRHAALECLAARHPAALPIPGIGRRLRAELALPFQDTDLASALEVLRDMGLVREHYDDLGAGKWYVATGEGLLKVERAH